MRRIMFITTLVVAGPGLYGMMRLMNAFDGALMSYGEGVRGHFGEGLGGVIGLLMIALPVILIAIVPLVLWVAIMRAAERRLGIRCPHCHRSLTAGCLSGRVLESGECSQCHARVFDEERVG